MSVVSRMILSESDLELGVLDLQRRNPGDVAGRGIVPGSSKTRIAFKIGKLSSNARRDRR